MTKDLNWKKVKEEPYRAGWRKMIRKTFVLLNGKEADYDTRDDGKTVSILAITKDDNIVLVRVFRPGPEKVLMEMPGGFIDKNEESIEAAKRELLEETGYSGEFEFTGEIVDDAYSNCIRNCFVAKNCIKVSEPKHEEDEDCEIIEMSLSDFRKHLRSGQLTDVESGYLSLDYLKLL